MELSDILLQYGALGVLAFVCTIAAKVMFDRLQKAYENANSRADRLEEELKQLNLIMRTDYVTVISRASQAMAEANRAVGDALAAVRRGP